MAQVDTTLGWSAKDLWLKYSQDAVLCEIGGFATSLDSTQPLPQISDPNEVFAKGKLIANRGNGFMLYYAACATGTEGVVCISSEQNSYVQFFSPNRDFKFYIGTLRSGSVREVGTYTGTSYSPNYQVYGNIGTTPIYYSPGWAIYIEESEVINIPQVTKQTMFNSLSLDISPITKSSAGYAVACVAKWKTSSGTVIQTPILISSDSSFTDMSTTGTYQFAKYNTRRDGIKFYMSFYQDISDNISTTLPVYDITGPDDPYANLNEIFNLICALDQANVQVTETIDPYAPFGNTEEGGGEVDPDPEDDDIEEPTLPGLSFAATGLCRIYRADLTALNQLASYMWTDNTFLQTLVNHAIQLIENPMDAIISLCLVPVAPPAFSVGAAEAVSVMYIPTPASMWPVINQFARVDCGTLDLEETYGSALDYNPYTKVSCFLPYIGFVDLDTDEVMGKTLNVVYRIDVVTGVCVAMIKVNGEVMYQFSGHCAIQMPLSSADFSTVISSLLQAGKLVAGAALTAAGAPEVGGMLLDAPQVSQPSTTVRKMVGTERNPNTGRQITTGTVTETVEKTGKPLSLGELAKRQSANTVGAIMNSKFGIEHSGGFSGNSGYLGVRRPFIIVKRPRLANPEQYGQYNGRPSMIYLNLGTCTGYTEVQSIQLTGIAATNSELSEIATLLKTGVIL